MLLGYLTLRKAGDTTTAKTKTADKPAAKHLEPEVPLERLLSSQPPPSPTQSVPPVLRTTDIVHSPSLAEALDLSKAYCEPQDSSCCPLHASNISTNGILRADNPRLKAYKKATGGEYLDALSLTNWHNAEIKKILASKEDQQMLQEAKRLGLLNEVRPIDLMVDCRTMDIDLKNRLLPEKLNVIFSQDSENPEPKIEDFDQKFRKEFGKIQNAITRIMISASPTAIPLDGSRNHYSTSDHWVNVGWVGSEKEFMSGHGKWVMLNSIGFEKGAKPIALCKGGPDAQGATIALKTHVINTWSKRTYDPQDMRMQLMCCLPIK
jgi:hypothetical protein